MTPSDPESHNDATFLFGELIRPFVVLMESGSEIGEPAEPYQIGTTAKIIQTGQVREEILLRKKEALRKRLAEGKGRRFSKN